MSSSPNYLEILKTAYYFDYVYLSQHIKTAHKSELAEQMLAVSQLEWFNTEKKFIDFFNKNLSEDKKLSEDDRASYFIVRQFLTAVRHEILKIKTTFPMESINESNRIAAKKILEFCYRWDYYPWEINRCPSAEGLAIFFSESNKLPSPWILPHNHKGKLVFNTLFFSGDFDSYTLSEDFKKNEMLLALEHEKEHILALLEEAGIDDTELAFKRIHNKTLTAQFIGRNVKETSLNNLFKFQKKLEQHPFQRGESIWPRIMGYALWETKHSIYLEKATHLHTQEELSQLFYSISMSDVFNRLKEVPIFKELLQEENHPIQKIFEQRNIERWFKATLESIQQGKYVTIS